MSGNTNPEISIIIVNYNGRVWLPACLESLHQQTHSNFEVIFVDNHSQDDSVPFVRSEYPSVHIIQHSSNTGFAAGSNSGLTAARGKYIMLLNTDTRMTPTCLEDLLTAFKQNPRLGCVQPKLIFMHEPDKLDSCGSYLTITGFLQHIGNQQSVNDPRYNKSFPVLSVKGACMMFPRSLLQNTSGLFDEIFWCYFEETDFCWRVWLVGYECWYYPQAVVYHAMGGTSGHHISHPTLQYHSLKNRLITYGANLSTSYALKIIPIHIALNLALSIFLLLTLQPRLAFAIWRALLYCVRNSKIIMRKRHIVQSQLRKIADVAWLPKLTRPIRIRQLLNQIYGLLTYERHKRKPITE